eukprot:13025507-Alexandrium_andersonii.AAC.1
MRDAYRHPSVHVHKHLLAQGWCVSERTRGTHTFCYCELVMLSSAMLTGLRYARSWHLTRIQRNRLTHASHGNAGGSRATARKRRSRTHVQYQGVNLNALAPVFVSFCRAVIDVIGRDNVCRAAREILAPALPYRAARPSLRAEQSCSPERTAPAQPPPWRASDGRAPAPPWRTGLPLAPLVQPPVPDIASAAPAGVEAPLAQPAAAVVLSSLHDTSLPCPAAPPGKPAGLQTHQPAAPMASRPQSWQAKAWLPRADDWSAPVCGNLELANLIAAREPGEVIKRVVMVRSEDDSAELKALLDSAPDIHCTRIR